MTRVRRITVGSALAVVFALAVGIAIGRLTAPSSPTGDPAGPRASANGVRVGYAHTPQGAVAAVTNYETFLDGPTFFNPKALDAGLRQIAAPGTGQLVGTIEANFGSARQQLDQQGATRGPLVVDPKPLGYRLVTYDGSNAQVVIWLMSIAGNQQRPADADFRLETDDVRWADGDWRLVDTHGAPGPAPRVQQPPSSPPDFVAAAQQFRGFRDAP